MAERLRTRIEEVTDRQLEVARLVTAGRTNPEIADALGITLDGAKYHVSELLGRLGLERREEIAGWYREEARPRRSRWLRALIGSPLAAGATAAGVAGAVLLGVLLVSALDGARAEDAASPSATPTPTPTEVTEEPAGSLLAPIASGDASDVPEHLQEIMFAFAQRLRVPSLDVATWEQHQWPDGCFDLDYPGGCPLSVSPVPGYRLTLRGADGEYVLRTGAQGGRYRVEAAPPVNLGAIVFTWQGGEVMECLDLQIAEDGRGTIAGCAEPATPFVLDDTGVGQSGMLDHLLTYRIDGQFPGGDVIVIGAGSESTGPGTIRAAFEYGAFLAWEAHVGRGEASFTSWYAPLAITWHDPAAEVCTSLEIQRYGVAHRTCHDPSEPARIYLHEGALQQFYPWIDRYSRFDMEGANGPDDARELTFYGMGLETPSVESIEEIWGWASGLAETR